MEIQILPEDFDYGGSNYTNPQDCPLFRACKRAGLNVLGVCPFGLKTSTITTGKAIYTAEWDSERSDRVYKGGRGATVNLKEYQYEQE